MSPAPWLFGSCAGQKIGKRFAVFRRADALLRHLGARRIGVWTDFEQFCDGLGSPDDVHLLQRVGETVAGQRRDPAAVQSGESRAGAWHLLVGEGMAGDAGPEYFSAMIAGIGGQC